jgi:2-dehydro-3-deoxyphosphooctonate aldolase (KDO 8-P synthase)
MVRNVPIGDWKIGPGGKFLLVAGPCVIESERHAMKMALALKAIAERAGVPFLFKASYDKANRTSITSFRGPGMEEGLRVLERIRREANVKVLSDVHCAREVEPAAAVLDVLQTPAFLCRQTDLLLAVAGAGKPVNVKKAQFLAPWDMKNVVDKILSTGNDKILLTERGVCFGYNQLVSDMRSLVILRELGCPVLFDVTHSVQQPGGLRTQSGGQREFVFPLVRAAAAVGMDGLFVEVHDAPDRALSDGPNSVPLERFPALLDQALAFHEKGKEWMQEGL